MTGFHSVTNRGIVPIWYTEWKPGFKQKKNMLSPIEPVYVYVHGKTEIL